MIDDFVLQSLIHTIPHAIFWKDKNLIFRGCNEKFASQFGYSDVKCIIGNTDYDLLFPADLIKKYHEDDLSIMKTRLSKINYEEIQLQPDGSEKVMLVSKVPYFNEANEIGGILGIYTDITERKYAESFLREAKERIESSDRAKTAFIENIRHDIRTPITGIIGFAHLIREHNADVKIKQYTDQLVDSTTMLLNLLNEILEETSLASGQLPILQKKFSLRDKLQSIIDLMQVKASEKKLSLTFEYDSSIPPFLVGDSKRIHRIFLELLSNALKFTDKGSIHLHAALFKQQDNDVVIKIDISDTGKGMTQEQAGHIYLRFNRFTPSYEGIYKGMGLGLTIAKKFIDDIKAEIYVDSQIGKGTVFSCFIPLKKALYEDAWGSDQSPDWIPAKIKQKKQTIYPSQDNVISLQHISESRLKILVVEDNELAYTVTADMLKQLQCVVDVAIDGYSAIEKFTLKNYDLVLLDIGLPDMTGYEVAKAIRLLNGSVPLVAVTAHINEEDKPACLSAGMNMVFHKPLEKEKLAGLLEVLVQDKRGAHTDKSKELSESSILDIAFTVDLMQNDEKRAKQICFEAIQSLKQDIARIQLAYEKKEINEVEKILKNILGGICYIGTPRFKKACHDFLNVVRNKNNNDWVSSFQKFLMEFDHVQKAVEEMQNYKENFILN